MRNLYHNQLLSYLSYRPHIPIFLFLILQSTNKRVHTSMHSVQPYPRTHHTLYYPWLLSLPHLTTRCPLKRAPTWNMSNPPIGVVTATVRPTKPLCPHRVFPSISHRSPTMTCRRVAACAD